jgi:Tol biopolymer transport system component
MPDRAVAAFVRSLAVAFVLCGGAACGGPAGSSDASPPGTEVYLAAFDDSAAADALGAARNVTRRPGYDNQPAFVPSGEALLYTSHRRGQADVYRYDRQADTTGRLTVTPESEYSPAPRPNGEMAVVRVEADGRQRLWQYGGDGRPMAPMLAAGDSVGYHAWLDTHRVALFVLGSPPTLQVVNVRTGRRDTVARRIGRSLQPVPGREAVSFVQVRADSTTAVSVYDGEGAVRTVAETPGLGRAVDHTWTPGGTLLMAAPPADTASGADPSDRDAPGASLLYARRPDADAWRAVADFDSLRVSRLAVSPDGSRLAFVAEE